MDMEINFPGGKKVNAEYKGFTIKTDQSTREGGDASAPEPFTLFLASIGTCAGIYVLNFCQNRNIPSDEIKIFLKLKKNKDTHMIENIIFDINLPKSFPDSYLKAMIRAINLCTVKKHLDKPPKLEISLKK